MDSFTTDYNQRLEMVFKLKKKKIKLLSVLIASFFYLALFPASAFAHIAGLPVFKVNNEYALVYPIYSVSSANFKLPQDLAPKNYLIDNNISFDFDFSRMGIPPEIVAKTKFAWDFGDGAKGTGITNSHTYSKGGSYFLTVTADDGTTPAPQIIESILVNVLPFEGYQLPNAIIKVNEKKVDDPFADFFTLNLTKPINFDGSSSSGQIVSYLWDFGDRQTDDKAKLTRSYAANDGRYFVVLRVADSNGFISDTVAELDSGNSESVSKTNKTPDNKKTIMIFGTISVVLLLALIFGSRRLLKKH